jgi:hypothetical protein
MRAHGVNVPDPEATPEGFIHPPPTKDASGQFQFDENEATPAWGSDAWYRVVFVTCTGPLPKP